MMHNPSGPKTASLKPTKVGHVDRVNETKIIKNVMLKYLSCLKLVLSSLEMPIFQIPQISDSLHKNYFIVYQVSAELWPALLGEWGCPTRVVPLLLISQTKVP